MLHNLPNSPPPSTSEKAARKSDADSDVAFHSPYLSRGSLTLVPSVSNNGLFSSTGTSTPPKTLIIHRFGQVKRKHSSLCTYGLNSTFPLSRASSFTGLVCSELLYVCSLSRMR